jgi:hypothetical protein
MAWHFHAEGVREVVARREFDNAIRTPAFATGTIKDNRSKRSTGVGLCVIVSIWR